MEKPDKKRLLAVLLILVAITVIYLWVDNTADDEVRVGSIAVTVSAIGLALVKFRIIMREFMDVRHAPPMLRRLTDLLVVVIAVSLMTTYVVGRAVA